MEVKKTKIVLDADVIIHFAKGGRLDILPRILPEFQFMVLDVVRREIPPLLLSSLDKMINRDKTLIEEQFGRTSGEMKEFAHLTATSGLALGKGESACMVYCLYHNDVLGSSNLRDVTLYCDEHGITYLTTVDFLFYAVQRNVLTKEEASAFVKAVVEAGSKLPNVNFDTYFCDKI
ncbi:MAG: hypothetical protein J6M23_03540 [Bacteroidales bacterium]|nr:hypothetical protein [Bacteroidales bacterium]